MRELDIRELKQSLSATLRLVDGGEPVRITRRRRGQPIADIVPPGAATGADRLLALVAQGRLVPATQPLPSAPPPLAPASRSATAVVPHDRDAER